MVNHGSHDCLYCLCPMHAWCGHSVKKTNAEEEEEEDEGHGVRRVCNRCYEARTALRALSADVAHTHTPATSAARPAVARARTHPAVAWSRTRHVVARAHARAAAGNIGNEDEADGEGEYIASAVHSPDEVAELLEKTAEPGDGNNNDDNWGELDAKGADLIKNPISNNCRNGYNNQNTLFLLYCFNHDRELLTDLALKEMDEAWNGAEGKLLTHKKRKEKLWQVSRSLLCDGDVSPVKLELITGQRFLCYLLSIRSATKTRLSNSSYGNKRAALFHLFRSFHVMQSNDLQQKLKMAMQGLMREVAIETQRGDGRIQTGMEPMSFLLYKALCKWFIQMDGSEGLFAHLFLALTWNLACRSANTCSIQLKHLTWANDCFQIYFAHQKNDQTGERKRHPRNIYPNPLDPVICPLFSLCLYLSVFPNVLSTCGPLFPGNNQYARFSSLMDRVIEQHREEVVAMGQDTKFIGVHSIQKGAATFASSGMKLQGISMWDEFCRVCLSTRTSLQFFVLILLFHRGWSVMK